MEDAHLTFDSAINYDCILQMQQVIFHCLY